MKPVKPFMKYMGGKRKMLPRLRPSYPASFGDYHEPFLGGGAVALDIMQRTFEAGERRTFFLSDYSTDVIDCWTAVKDYPQELADNIKSMFAGHSREHFNHIKHWDRNGLLEGKTVAERAARFIYLMTGTYSGIIKTTSDGHMAMSYAWDTNKRQGIGSYDFENMFAVSEMLNHFDTHIFHASYEAVADKVGFGDFVYLDPPYETTADSGSTICSEYLQGGIDHGQVKEVILETTALGAFVLMSNSCTAVTRELFENWAQIRPQHHWIGHTGMREGSELLVANWRLADHIHRQQALAA